MKFKSQQRPKILNFRVIGTDRIYIDVHLDTK